MMPPTDAACSPPAFAGPDCFTPGCDAKGCVTRCHEPDGSFWDKQSDGTAVHWHYASVNPDVVEVICEVTK